MLNCRSDQELNLDYQSCVAGGGKVVSHVFCLPNSYRKDVLPPTESKIRDMSPVDS